jgi:hypothetical protein
MKKMFGVLLVALSLFVGVPQADAALHHMGNGSDGTKYYLDDVGISPLSGRKVEYSLHIHAPHGNFIERVYIHKVDGMWMYQAEDGLDRLCRGTDWARNSLQWLFHNGYLVD